MLSMELILSFVKYMGLLEWGVSEWEEKWRMELLSGFSEHWL